MTNQYNTQLVQVAGTGSDTLVFQASAATTLLKNVFWYSTTTSTVTISIKKSGGSVVPIASASVNASVSSTLFKDIVALQAGDEVYVSSSASAGTVVIVSVESSVSVSGQSISVLNDVDTTGSVTDDLLVYNGSSWVPQPLGSFTDFVDIEGRVTAAEGEIDTNAAAIVSEASTRAASDSALDTRLTAAEGEIDTLQSATHVNSLNALTGAVTLSAGTHVTLTQVGNDIEIASSGGGGGSDSFNTIAVPGQSDIEADSGNDTLNITAGNGIALTTTPASDTLNIAVDATTTEIPEGTNLYYTDARVAANSAVVANTAKNSYPTADASKLAGIAAGAEVNVNADWTATSGDAQILNKPTLSAVATSGAYADLSGTPTIPTDLSDLTGDTGDVPEGTNLYFTETRVQTYLSANLNFSEAPVVQINGSTALTDTHANKFIECTNGGAITLSISAGIRRSAEIVVMQASTGAVTITAGANVTLRNTTPFLNITAEQYALVGLKQLGTTDVWVITGERKLA
jgi:uncharacterized Zn-binding protein involved in type VI secretion